MFTLLLTYVKCFPHIIRMVPIISLIIICCCLFIFSCMVKFTLRYFLIIQIINVYNQEYESAAAFWPDVHGRIISALIISQLLLMGLLSTKEAAQSTPFLIALPILTITFHYFCKGRYEPAFTRYPLQVCSFRHIDF